MLSVMFSPAWRLHHNPRSSRQIMAWDMLVPALNSFVLKWALNILLAFPITPKAKALQKGLIKPLKICSLSCSLGGGILYPQSGNFKTLLNHALFVLNFLTYDTVGKSAADCLWHLSTANNYARAMWRDPLSNKWQGPDPVLIWGKGHACIYDSRAQNARWLPEHLINHMTVQGRKTLRKFLNVLLCRKMKVPRKKP